MSITPYRLKLRLLVLLITLSVVLSIYVIWRYTHQNPAIHYLADYQSISWTLSNDPISQTARVIDEETTLFATEIQISSHLPESILAIRAFKSLRLVINDQEILKLNHTNWKKNNFIKMPRLSPGKYAVFIEVKNSNGPPAFWLNWDTIGLSSNSFWLASKDGATWNEATRSNLKVNNPISKQFPSTLESLSNTAPYAVIIFTLFFLAGLNNIKLPGTTQVMYSLIGLWLLMGLNSLMKYPHGGFDYNAHLEYVRFVATGSLPLAPEGMQTFQSPLYYLLTAILYKPLSMLGGDQLAAKSLKIIPLFCGLAQTVICYFIAKLVFPEKRHLQIIMLLFGSLLPMNLYMSQYWGNEPLAGTFSAAIILLVIYWVKKPSSITSKNQQLILGTTLGLALLTKISAVLLFPVIFLTLIYLCYKQRIIVKRSLFIHLRIITPCLLVSGWYYLGNWWVLGKPFIGGWDPSRGIEWWQDPGYTTFRHFFSFGTSLQYPLYSAIDSFWDGLYSSLWLDGYLGGFTHTDLSPWNVHTMTSMAILSLMPTLALILSPIELFKSKSDTKIILLQMLSLIGLFLGAIAFLNLKAPIFSTLKSSYTLGILPAYAILITMGFKIMLNYSNLYLRSVIGGLIACWCSFSYASFFIIRPLLPPI